MELTSEQQAIIRSTGNIKINAVAGSGKTTTIIEYAKTRPASSRILYLAFNKAVKREAMKKFADKGMHDVKVETAHSLAYRHIVGRYGYTVRGQGYKTSEIAGLLKLQGNGEKHTEYMVANHVVKFSTFFCNSDKQRVQELNYLDTITDDKAYTFVSNFYDYIEGKTRLLLSKMNSGEIEVTHDFYLKKFQLSNPVLPYDYILFDEGQDASPAMLDIFLKQSATKVIVGDVHQQIYSWRHAVNSLQKADFATLHLSTSFRFSQDIADLAMEVLKLKNHLQNESHIPIKGMGSSPDAKTKAVLARTNLGLLVKAIGYVTEQKNAGRIYFEGNINSYTYADEGASLYDVLNLHNGRRHLIKDKLMQTMKNTKELEEYVEKTEDKQLDMMLEIVKEYGDEIPGIIRRIKEQHVENDDREKAEIIFSTVHRCKGMEYDAIEIVDDFITGEKLEKLKKEKKEELQTSKLNEEINLLYVAVTRTKNSIRIPQALLPKGFPSSSRIHVIKPPAEAKKNETEMQSESPVFFANGAKKMADIHKAYSVDEVREQHKGAYKPWTEELDEELTVMYCEGRTIRDMANQFGRTTGAIYSRIKKLNLPELYG